MFFTITSMWQILGWILAFAGLIILNEVARRTKLGGLVIFGIVPAVLTVYFVVVNILGATGVWPDNWTFKYMNGWFHYAKLYASLAGCIGFMMLKYKWGVGAKRWFKPFPFLIVAINILIAVASDFESAIKGAQALAETGSAWWYSSEGVYLYGGWWNWVNGIAGILNIACMTGWFGIYSSKDKKDMLWPDMTWVYILAYDVWNFEYTYLNLPSHAWYCGLALLLAPTVAAALWNKGGWIQNRANTLCTWCMFAQTVPVFQDFSVFTTLTSVYPKGYTWQDMANQISPAVYAATNHVEAANPNAQGLIAMAALIINVIALLMVAVRAIKAKKNPYTNEIFCDQKDFIEAMSRAE